MKPEILRLLITQRDIWRFNKWANAWKTTLLFPYFKR